MSEQLMLDFEAGPDVPAVTQFRTVFTHQCRTFGEGRIAFADARDRGGSLRRRKRVTR